MSVQRSPSRLRSVGHSDALPRSETAPRRMPKADYKAALRALQVELLKIQRRAIRHDHRVLLLFEGRDAAGKDGVIKRIARYLSPRDTRVVALPKPSDRDARAWYFQRYTPHLPANGEIVLFNRSWYNRAGVERVMDFTRADAIETFFQTVGDFERMLVRDGMLIRKYYLDISRDEQARRLDARASDPLKQWKRSPIDTVALDHWDAYSSARDEMLRRTSFDWAPWCVIRTDDKRRARIAALAHIVRSIDCPDTDKSVAKPDPTVVIEAPAEQFDRLYR
ncbi:polyphosphate kinase 2 [Rhodothalassium salexigens]|uniref:polyphosphate kinase 2 n=1 Tax=Rhodothalassium salexigens TaxID=1086 RepID=UPI001911547E|nr:polyphosphate kinase 2 [Rhodothalassium salexigens]MBK5910635.1 polyphosphate kinase 2 [Rhodothalassium salexigens]MBK5920570.1 polyphosphate kinase 2 [Rhodothalassium salexigens]